MKFTSYFTNETSDDSPSTDLEHVCGILEFRSRIWGLIFNTSLWNKLNDFNPFHLNEVIEERCGGDEVSDEKEFSGREIIMKEGLKLGKMLAYLKN